MTKRKYRYRTTQQKHDALVATLARLEVAVQKREVRIASLKAEISKLANELSTPVPVETPAPVSA